MRLMALIFMQQELKQIWRQALSVLAQSIDLSKLPKCPVLKWKREGASWNGKYVQDVDFLNINFERKSQSELMKQMTDLLNKYHPQYCKLIGTDTFGYSNLGTEYYLQSTAFEVLRRLIIGNHLSTSIDAVLDDVELFIDSEEILVDYVAPLVNVSGQEDFKKTELGENIYLDRLSNEEINTLFGGRMDFFPSRAHRMMGPLTFCIRGHFLEKKKIADENSERGHQEPYRETLNLAILALRTYRTGPIGYDWVRFQPRNYTPWIPGPIDRFWNDSYVPLGNYKLWHGEEKSINKHVKHFQVEIHNSLEAACNRLASAEIRMNAQERLFDVVVGMESILLCEIPEGERGELRFRFALNLASLQKQDRELYFKIGKNLYDLRSRIAHGASIKGTDEVQYGREQLILDDVSKRACELLRSLIHRFIVNAAYPEYIQSCYWSSRYFPSTLTHPSQTISK